MMVLPITQPSGPYFGANSKSNVTAERAAPRGSTLSFAIAFFERELGRVGNRDGHALAGFVAHDTLADAISLAEVAEPLRALTGGTFSDGPGLANERMEVLDGAKIIDELPGLLGRKRNLFRYFHADHVVYLS